MSAATCTFMHRFSTSAAPPIHLGLEPAPGYTSLLGLCLHLGSTQGSFTYQANVLNCYTTELTVIRLAVRVAGPGVIPAASLASLILQHLQRTELPIDNFLSYICFVFCTLSFCTDYRLHSNLKSARHLFVVAQVVPARAEAPSSGDNELERSIKAAMMRMKKVAADSDEEDRIDDEAHNADWDSWECTHTLAHRAPFSSQLWPAAHCCC